MQLFDLHKHFYKKHETDFPYFPPYLNVVKGIGY